MYACLHRQDQVSRPHCFHSPGTAYLALVLQCTQHGGDDYAKIVQGDPGIESIYNWNRSGPTVAWRGATGKGDGVHVLTGQLLTGFGWLQLLPILQSHDKL